VPGCNRAERFCPRSPVSYWQAWVWLPIHEAFADNVDCPQKWRAHTSQAPRVSLDPLATAWDSRHAYRGTQHLLPSAA
jgi:hypothetical protein